MTTTFCIKTAHVASNRDLATEGHVRALAAWGFLAGVVFLLLLAISTGMKGPRPAGLLLGGGLAGLSFAWAAGMWRYRGAAWFLTGAVTLLGGAGAVVGSAQGVFNPFVTLSAVIQLVWCGSILRLLFGARGRALCKTSYREQVARSDESVRFWRSPFLYLPAVVILAQLGLAALSR